PCTIPRDLLDRAKEMAREKSGPATARMMIAATHTHSAPAAIGTLGWTAHPAHRALQQLERQRHIPPGIDILLVETECYPVPGPRKNRRLSIRRPLDLPDPTAMLRMGSGDPFLEVGARGVGGLAMLDGHVQLGHHSHLGPIWYLTDVQKQRKFFSAFMLAARRE